MEHYSEPFEAAYEKWSSRVFKVAATRKISPFIIAFEFHTDVLKELEQAEDEISKLRSHVERSE